MRRGIIGRNGLSRYPPLIEGVGSPRFAHCLLGRITVPLAVSDPSFLKPERKFRARVGSFMAMRKIPWGDLALWAPTLFLVYVFASQGLAKFSNESGWATAFALWHYPVWFRILIGACETTAAALLLTRRTAPLGAALIAAVMVGAMGTHISRGHPEQVTSEVVPLTLSLIVVWGRWQHFARVVSGWRRGAS